MPGLIDTHTHLEGFARRGELPAVLDRARAAGVVEMIAIGTAPDDWAQNRGLAAAHSGIVHYTIGLHPCSVEEGWEQAMAQIEGFWHGAPGLSRDHATEPRAYPNSPQTAGDRCRSLLAGDSASAIASKLAPTTASPKPSPDLPQPVAIGEIGLDRFHLPKDAAAAERLFGRQRAAFSAGLQLARRLGVPVVVHSRGAFRECVEMIDTSGIDWSKVVFHCFGEGVGEMDALIQRGGFGSFTGIITYKNAEGVRDAAKRQGLDRLMIETDAPYLAPVPHRGKTNEPAYVRHTAEFCAGLFGVSYDELAAVTTANARAFFGLNR
jgi:TatD DNase family protein